MVAPTLVLLPGMDGTGELFARFVAAMPPAQGTSVLSYPTDEPLGYAALESSVREHLPTKGRFALLAESFSGPIAIAASPPPGLCGVILCCSFVASPRPMLRVLRPLTALVSARGLPASVVARALFGRFATPDLRRDLARATARVSPATFRARLRAIQDVDVAAQLSRVSVPLLYLRATEDRVVPRTASRRISSLLPGARVVDVEAPHLLLQAAPAAAARAIGGFLRETGADT